MRCVVLVSCLLICGCPLDLDTMNMARQRPADADLIGRYVSTPGSARWINVDGKHPGIAAQLVLSADGSFEARNVPRRWFDSDAGQTAGLDSFMGTWKTVKRQDWWDVGLKFDPPSNPVSGSTEGTYSTSVPIMGQAPPYFIWFYLGGPDSTEIIVFARSTSEEQAAK